MHISNTNHNKGFRLSEILMFFKEREKLNSNIYQKICFKIQSPKWVSHRLLQVHIFWKINQNCHWKSIEMFHKICLIIIHIIRNRNSLNIWLILIKVSINYYIWDEFTAYICRNELLKLNNFILLNLICLLSRSIMFRNYYRLISFSLERRI